MTSIAASRTSWLKRLVYMWVAAAVVLFVSIGETAAQPKSGETAAQPKKILFLHSFGPNFEQGAAWSREIQKELNRQSPWPLNIQEQSLVTALDGDDAAEAKFVEYLGALYAQRPPDLIVALGAPAARFVQQHRTDLYPTTPMLLAAVEVRRVEPSMLSEQDAVAGVRFDQVAAVENILRLLPETKAIAIIIGNSPGERFWAGEQQRILGPLLKNKVELIFYGEQPFEEILKEVASLPPHTAIFYQQLAVDGAGAVYGDKEPLKRIYEVANAPIFSFDETYFNGEIVGGPMFSPAEGARPTGCCCRPNVGRREGKWHQGSSNRLLNTEIRLATTSALEHQREPPATGERNPVSGANGVGAVFVADRIHRRGSSDTGRAYLGPATEHRRRQFAEVQSRQRMTELAHVNRFATAGELTASIAHEINQPLGSILTNAETAEAILKSPSPDIAELKEIVSDILQDDRRATEVIRRMRSLLKKAPFEQKQFDLNEVVQETIGFFSSLAVGRKVRTG